MEYELIGLVFGIIGFICMLLSIYNNKKEKILKLLKLKAIFYSLQYLCLGAMSGCISMVLAIFRSDLIRLKERNPKYSKIIFTILISLYIANSILTYETNLDYLTIVGNVIYLGTLWFFKDIGIKIGTIFSVSIWMVYNYLVGAYIGTLSDLIVGILAIHYVIKYYKKKKCTS